MVKARPDLARVMLGIEGYGDDALLAQGAVNGQADLVARRLRQLGVDKDGIRTVSVDLIPVSRPGEWPEGTRVVGFRGAQTLEVTVADLADLGPVLDGAVQAGVSTVQSIRLGFRNEADYQRRALDLAVKDARIRAEAVASTSKVALVGLRSLVVRTGPGGSEPETPVRGAAPRPIPTDVTIRTVVEATFDVR